MGTAKSPEVGFPNDGVDPERSAEPFYQAALMRLCGQGQSHQHSCRYTLDFSDRSRKAVSQIIDAWPDQEKFVIAASALVKNGRVATYRLQTAFRPWPRISAKAHQRKARERARNLQTVYPRCVIEIHDE